MNGDLHGLENAGWLGVGRRMLTETMPIEVNGLEVTLGDWYDQENLDVQEKRKVSSAAVFPYVPELNAMLLVSGEKEDKSRRVEVPSGAVDETKDTSALDIARRELFEETGLKTDQIWPIVYSTRREGAMGVQFLALLKGFNGNFVDPDGRVYRKPFEGALEGETTGLILEPIEMFFDRQRSLLFQYTEHPWAYNPEVLYSIFMAVCKVPGALNERNIEKMKKIGFSLIAEYLDYVLAEVLEGKSQEWIEEYLARVAVGVMDDFDRMVKVRPRTLAMQLELEMSHSILSYIYLKLTGMKLEDMIQITDEMP
jgi:8-oxo-dGTP pyrophosphatase MutT (NUDIX family)